MANKPSLDGYHILRGGYAEVRRIPGSRAELYWVRFEFHTEGSLVLQRVPRGLLLPLLYRVQGQESVSREEVLSLAQELYRPRRRSADELISESHENDSPIK